MPAWDDVLNQWLQAGVRVVLVNTWDEPEFLSQAQKLALRRGGPLWRWSRLSGLVRDGQTLQGALTRDPEVMLEKLLALPDGVVAALDLLTEELSATAARALRELSQSLAPVMLLASAPPGMRLPFGLQRSAAAISLGDPLGPSFRQWLKSPADELAGHIRRQQTEMPGLTAVGSSVNWDQVGGLAHLKTWAFEHKLALDPSRGLPFPRGVLLYGVPGTGKSLSVKAWAASWNVPLWRLDWGGLFGRYVGESEGRLMEALGAMERMAPGILWIDEMDKAFGLTASEDDGGVSRR